MRTKSAIETKYLQKESRARLQSLNRIYNQARTAPAPLPGACLPLLQPHSPCLPLRASLETPPRACGGCASVDE